MYRKGQSSIEQLTITALGLTFVAVIFYFSINFSNDSTRVSQAQDTINKLANAADYVYALGPGSKDVVTVYMPQGMRYANLTGSTIIIRVSLSSGDSDVFANTKAQLVGTLPQFSGPQDITVTALPNGKVKFGDTFLTCDPASITKTIEQEGTSSASVTLTNIGDTPITGITSSFSTQLSTLVSDSFVDNSTLNAEASTPITLTFTIPLAQTVGTYGGFLTLNGTDQSECTTSITIFVTQKGGPDLSGPIVSGIYHSPIEPGFATPITISALSSDATTGGSTVSSCDLEIDYSGIWNNMNAVDGSFNSITENINLSIGTLGTGTHTVRLKCMDALSNLGPLASYTFLVGANGTGPGIEDITGPIVINIAHTANPTAFSNISVSGTADDQYTGNSTIKSCNIKIDSGAWIPIITPTDGAWDAMVEPFTYNIGPLPVGQHYVYYQCTDSWDAVGSIYPDDFIVVDVDLMIVLDRSGSMADPVTNAANSVIVSTTSSSWALVKSLNVQQKNGDIANLTVETRAGSSGCTVSYNATISGVQVATGSRTSTSYGSTVHVINVSSYTTPYTIDLYLKRSTSGCTVYNRLLSLTQQPTKMNAVKSSSKTFVDIAGNSIQAGLVSYSTSATTDKQLAMMTTANQAALKTAIDALSPTGSTCIECGLVNGANELVSARARPGATKAIILLTDGQANVGDSIAGAVYCRDRNVTVYTIGFGYDVDSVELTNIALLTYGQYYFAPDVATLIEIFNSLGRTITVVDT